MKGARRGCGRDKQSSDDGDAGAEITCVRRGLLAYLPPAPVLSSHGKLIPSTPGPGNLPQSSCRCVSLFSSLSGDTVTQCFVVERQCKGGYIFVVIYVLYGRIR